MNDQTLKNLLSEADQNTTRPAIRSDLRNQVFARLRRRRSTRRGVALVLVTIALLPMLHSRHTSLRTPSSPPVLAVAPTPRSSPWDEVVERRTIQAIFRLQDHGAIVRSLPLDPLQRLQMDSAATAATLIAAGDYLSRDPASAAQGNDHYQRVRTYFPKTSWSVQAEQRLSRDRS